MVKKRRDDRAGIERGGFEPKLAKGVERGGAIEKRRQIARDLETIAGMDVETLGLRFPRRKGEPVSIDFEGSFRRAHPNEVTEACRLDLFRNGSAVLLASGVDTQTYDRNKGWSRDVTIVPGADPVVRVDLPGSFRGQHSAHTLFESPDYEAEFIGGTAADILRGALRARF